MEQSKTYQITRQIFVSSCNTNPWLDGLALGLGINFFSKSDSILVIDNGSIGEISAHFRMLLIGFWNAVERLTA